MEENRRNMRRRGRFGGRRAAANRQQAASRGMTRGGFLRNSGLAAAGLGAAALGMGRVAKAKGKPGTPDHSQGALVIITSERIPGSQSYTSHIFALVYDADNRYLALAPLLVNYQGGAGYTGTTIKQGVSIDIIPFGDPLPDYPFNLNNQQFDVTRGVVYEWTGPDPIPIGAIIPTIIGYVLGEDPPEEPYADLFLIAEDGVGRLHASLTPNGDRHGSFQGTVTLLNENFDPYKYGVKLLINVNGPDDRLHISRVDIFE